MSRPVCGSRTSCCTSNRGMSGASALRVMIRSSQESGSRPLRRGSSRIRPRACVPLGPGRSTRAMDLADPLLRVALAERPIERPLDGVLVDHRTKIAQHASDRRRPNAVDDGDVDRVEALRSVDADVRDVGVSASGDCHLDRNDVEPVGLMQRRTCAVRCDRAAAGQGGDGEARSVSHRGSADEQHAGNRFIDESTTLQCRDGLASDVDVGGLFPGERTVPRGREPSDGAHRVVSSHEHIIARGVTVRSWLKPLAAARA